MALVKCKECGEKVSTKAKTCPSCGTKVKKPLSMLRFIIYASVATFVLVAVMAKHESNLASMTPEERAAREEAREARQAERERAEAQRQAQQEERRCSDQTMAFVMSQNFVKQRLRAPSTAKFPSVTNDGVRTQYLGDCTHRVQAFVDSQNGFGATIRTRYQAELRKQPDANSWNLIDIQIYE